MAKQFIDQDPELTGTRAAAAVPGATSRIPGRTVKHRLTSTRQAKYDIFSAL
jgi:hypothetical protein